MEIILGLIVMATMALTVFIEKTGVTNNKFTDTITISNDNETNMLPIYIKCEILNIYRDKHCKDRRELIVNRLRQLQFYEDPGEFLETHHYVHEYIFNRYIVSD